MIAAHFFVGLSALLLLLGWATSRVARQMAEEIARRGTVLPFDSFPWFGKETAATAQIFRDMGLDRLCPGPDWRYRTLRRAQIATTLALFLSFLVLAAQHPDLLRHAKHPHVRLRTP